MQYFKSGYGISRKDSDLYIGQESMKKYIQRIVLGCGNSRKLNFNRTQTHKLGQANSGRTNGTPPIPNTPKHVEPRKVAPRQAKAEYSVFYKKGTEGWTDKTDF